jgi:hypothetical protein
MRLETFLPVFLLALGAIVVALAAMAVGVVFKRPCLRGSCGGPAVLGPDGDKLSCATCPNRPRAGDSTPRTRLAPPPGDSAG